MTFSDNAELKFNLNQYTTRPDAAAAVRLIPYRLGRTNTADAIRFARDNMFSTSQFTYIFCFSLNNTAFVITRMLVLLFPKTFLEHCFQFISVQEIYISLSGTY